MGARFYDEAVVEKFNKWIPEGSSIRILKPNETSRLFSMNADATKDRLTLPIIALSRSGYRILDTRKQPKTKDGITIRIYDDKGKEIKNESSLKLNAIPIQLEYQLDIICQNLDECDEYARNFAFNIINYNTSEIVLPYNDLKVTHKFTMNLIDAVEDNSDVPERVFPSQFSRLTLGFVIDDAYLFSIPSKKNAKLEAIELDSYDSTSKETEELASIPIISVTD